MRRSPWGIVGALLLHGVVFYVMAAAAPWNWFAMARNRVNILTHVVFGAIVGWWYGARARAWDEHRVPA